MKTPSQYLDLRFLISRSRLVLQSPRKCWDTIAIEQTPPKELVAKLILPLVVCGIFVTVISLQSFGIYVPLFGTWKPSLITSTLHQVADGVVRILSLYLDAWVLSKLTLQFQASISFDRAFSVLAHSSIPVLIAGLLGFGSALQIIALLLLAPYSVFILFQGVQRMVIIPKERALGFFVVLLVALLIVHLLTFSLVAPLEPTPFASLLSE